MTLQPVFPLLLLVVALAVAGALIWWPPGRSEQPETVVAKGRRTAMVVLLFLAALRPGVPGGDVTVDATDLDVFFVVDTTVSVVAEDYASGEPRLTGMRTDVKDIARGLPGARYSVLTFDHETVTRLPLTSDASALDSAMDVLAPETSTYSQGSSVSVAQDELDAALTEDQQAHPDRARLVFYLGDGEQTASSSPAPFDIEPSLVNGGAVLGYGTREGGRMQQTGTRSDGYVVDPSTGQPARSKIDEQELRAIASQLRLPYLHRTNDDGAVPVLDAVQLKETGSLTTTDQTRSLGGRAEYYWLLLLGFAALAAWEVAVALAEVSGLGSRVRPDRREAPGRTRPTRPRRVPRRAATRRTPAPPEAAPPPTPTTDAPDPARTTLVGGPR